MPSTTVEDYLKSIYLALAEKPGVRMSTGQLAAAMGVTPGTATSMLKTLADSGLVEYEPYAGVSLTKQGTSLALHMVRRHRLIELFLVKVLGLSWDQVHAEADALEHAVSDRIIERVDEMLGYPSVDPHGDPIPKEGEAITSQELKDLTTCPLNETMTLRRVTDQDPEFLGFLDKNKLTPPAEVLLEKRDDHAGTMDLRVGGKVLTISRETALKLLIQL